MRSSLDDIAGIFLEDLGITNQEEDSYREGEDMEDYLPVRRQDAELTRTISSEYPRVRNVPQRRLTRAEKLIIQEIRESELVQEGASHLTESAIEREGQVREHTAITLQGEFQRLLLLKDLAYVQSKELGEIMEPTIKRMIHDRTNDALRKHNLMEEYDSRLIEESYKAREHAAMKRTRWQEIWG